jgi:hypothetical protein
VQGNGPPLRAALHHKFAVIIEIDGEEDVFGVVKIINHPAVEIDIDLFDAISKNKKCVVVFPKRPLPVCKTFDIVGCDPAFKAGKFLEARTFESPAFDFGDNDRLAGRIQQIIKTFYFPAPKRSTLLLIDGNEMDVIINQPVRKRSFVVVEMKIFHYRLRTNPLEKFVDINILLLTRRHILNHKLIFLRKFLADDNTFFGILSSCFL